MVICEYWVIWIAIAIVAIAFAALVVYSIFALISLRKLLRNANELVVDLEEKARSLDPYFHVASGVGEALECFSGRKKGERSNKWVDLVECSLVGLSLWQKLKEKK